MHDFNNLEGRGIPAMFIASSEFIDAAEAQASALGCDPAVVFLPHPIQNRSDDEMRALAREHADAVLAAIASAQ